MFLLQRYASERFLFRLGSSVHGRDFVLKGAALFSLWGGSQYRPTRDLDFTGFLRADAAGVLAAMREVCSVSLPEDGMLFDATTLSAEEIRDESEYHGLRVKLTARLENARVSMQIDIGFGNAIEPSPRDATYPTPLDMPAPHVRAYPQEAVVAEKLHAMFILGERNSRYKDFYDIHTMAKQLTFKGDVLSRSVAATFERRQTAITEILPAALTPAYYANEDQGRRWRAYLNRNKLPGAPADFARVGELILSFLGPVWRALGGKQPFAGAWPPGGPWSSARAT